MKESMHKSKSDLSFKDVISTVFGMRYIFIWIFLIVYVVFIIVSPTYRLIGTFLDILRLSSIGALLYLGLTWVIAAGELDLSFTEIAAFVCVMFAYFMTQGISIWLSALIAFCLGLLWGAINGLFVGILGLPSLITTLAVGAAAKGIMTTIIEARPVRVITVGPVIDKIVFGTVLGGLPISFIIILVIYLIMRFIQDRTIIGHYIYIIGENRVAAKAAGINSKNIIFGVFILSSVFASFAGILLTGLYQTGNPDVGSLYLLEGLLAVYLGSMIIKDVKPNLIGTLITIVFLGVLINGFTVLGIQSYILLIVKGLLLLIGIIIVFLRKNYGNSVIKRDLLKE